MVAEMASPIPSSFETAVDDAVDATVACISDGNSRVQISYDLTAGDKTYSMLHSSLNMMQKFVEQFTERLEFDEDEESGELGSEATAPPERTVRLYFPDAGSAALAQRDWKVGQSDALVPNSTRFSWFSSKRREQPGPNDAAVIFVCPRATEVDALQEVRAWVRQRKGLHESARCVCF
jgi:hypothetical protein